MILQRGQHLEFKSNAIASLIMTTTKYKWLGLLIKVIPRQIRDQRIIYLQIIEIGCGRRIGIIQMNMKNPFHR